MHAHVIIYIMPYELAHIHQICLDEAFNAFLSERFPPSTKKSTCGMIYAEFRLWSIIMWTVWRVITRVSCNVTAKSVMHGIGKWKNTTAKFSSRVTCFIHLVSLARPILAIARESLASKTIWYSVVGHRSSILLQLDYMYKFTGNCSLPWSLL